MVHAAKKLLLVLLTIGSLQVIAQKKAPPEFSIYAAGGISTYCFQPANKETSSLGFSSDFGAGFTGFFNQQLGIHTGAGFGLFSVKSKISSLQALTKGLFDEKNELSYDLHTTLKGYTEIHKVMFVTIPVMLQFQSKQKQYWNWQRSQKAGFYALAGAKLILMFNNKYEARIDTLSNAAYFPSLDNWAATQTFAKLGAFEGNTVDNKLDFGVMVMFACEAGVKWRVDNNIIIYTGAYFDCALYDPIKDSRQPYSNFTDPDKLPELAILKIANRTNLMVVGIKVRVAFTKYQRPY